MAEIPTARIGRLTYRLPFASLFRAHTPAERERLESSIKARGIRVRVVTYTSAAHGPRSVIDGATRLAIAAALELSAVPVQDLGELPDEAARELALTLNADRRHLSLDELQAERLARIDRVAEARGDGASVRQIAAAEGVSVAQVQRDLTAAREKTTPTPDAALVAARRALKTLRGKLEYLLESEWSPHVRRLLDRHRADQTAAVIDALLSDLALEAAQGFASE